MNWQPYKYAVLLSEPLEVSGRSSDYWGDYQIKTSFSRCKDLAQAILAGQHYYCWTNNIYIPSKNVIAINILKVEKK